MKTVHLDLGPDGFEGQWLDIADPKFITQYRWEELAEKAKTDEGAIIRELVDAWHLENYAGLGAPSLTDPKTDDLKCLTFGHIKIITEKIRDLFQAQLPKA